jgi:hypothetical protein
LRVEVLKKTAIIIYQLRFQWGAKIHEVLLVAEDWGVSRISMGR